MIMLEIPNIVITVIWIHISASFITFATLTAATPIAEIAKMEPKINEMVVCTFISGVIKKYLLAACCFVSNIFDFSSLIHAKGLGVIIHLLVDVFVKETMFVTRDVTMNGSINKLINLSEAEGIFDFFHRFSKKNSPRLSFAFSCLSLFVETSSFKTFYDSGRFSRGKPTWKNHWRLAWLAWRVSWWLKKSFKLILKALSDQHLLSGSFQKIWSAESRIITYLRLSALKDRTN